MADEQTPAKEPDMIAQVGEMIARVTAGEYCVKTHIDIGDEADSAILVASALLAVAAEIRGVRNELADWKDGWWSRQ